ncbi:extracellular solute-binding protein [Georgenia subflava]|uniref:Extracellular solute-binding protein n=1 Tax=Georgenia subflava TaxID=1622177 RepID=A0A6N7EMI5_9MICO|nr:extracellular solute-binding protein [Georgenia subflava]MPV36454.1 extracellular solute-binding protein [Georgenia subflava]
MKRLTAVKSLSVAAALTITLAACSGADGDEGAEENGGDQAASADPADVEGSVTFWSYPIGVTGEGNWWGEHVDAFNEIYPNVDVEVVIQPWTNREETLVTSIAGGQAPDVVYFNPDFIPKFAEEGVLTPMDEVADLDAFVPSSLDAMTWDDTVYSVPLLMQIQTSYCNTEVLAAAGVEKCPTTWDELAEAGPAVKEAGHYLTEYTAALGMTLNHTFYAYLWQAGGEVLSEDNTEATFNGPEGLEALEFIKQMVDEGWVPEQALTVNDPFEQTAAGREEVAYMMGANLTTTREVVNPDVIEVVPPMTGKEQVSTGSVGGLSIFNTAESPEAAEAWVEYVTGAEFMKTFIEETGYLPPRTDVTGLFEDDPQIAGGLEYLDTVRVGVMHPSARQLIDTISPHIQAVLLGQVEPQAGLDAAAAEVDEILARSGS